MTVFDEMPALIPIDFFGVTVPIHFAKDIPTLRQMKKSFLLPDTSELLAEEHFADVALSWNEMGLNIAIWVSKPFEEASYPTFGEGDALELFVDTRDLKTAGFMTRFCHHFVILPQAVLGVHALEITRFRTEDAHPLCDPLDLKVEAVFAKDSYSVQVNIPAHALHGYDPIQCNKIGFNYRIHRYKDASQHFSVSSQDYPIESQPRLWGSLNLETRLNLNKG